MPSPRLASSFIALAGAVFIACSDQSPVTPEGISEGAGGPSRLAQAVPGLYTLTFVSGGQVVTTLPVGSEVALKAEVTDTSGAPARSGTVAFEYCSFKGLPPNDIDRVDEAPKEECEGGDGKWAHLLTVRVDASGIPLVGFGFVQTPRTIGFRFRYSGGQASGIGNGAASENFTWCPPTGCD